MSTRDRLVFLFFVISFSFLSACRDRASNRLMRDMEGRWTIEQIILTDWHGPGQDSVVDRPGGTFVIEPTDDPQTTGYWAYTDLPDGEPIGYYFEVLLDGNPDQPGVTLTFTGVDDPYESNDGLYLWQASFVLETLTEEEMVLINGWRLGDANLASSKVDLHLSR